MTDKPERPKPLTCPLCGTKAKVSMLGYVSDVSYNVSCGLKDDDSDSCGLVLFGGAGEPRKQVVAKWNRRTATADLLAACEAAYENLCQEGYMRSDLGKQLRAASEKAEPTK